MHIFEHSLKCQYFNFWFIVSVNFYVIKKIRSTFCIIEIYFSSLHQWQICPVDVYQKFLMVCVLASLFVMKDIFC